jgi:integrase
LRTSLQQDAQILSHHLYHYNQKIYQSIDSGCSQLSLQQIKQIVQQELQKYRQQIGLSSSIRFEAPVPLIKLSDLLNEFWSFKQKNGASEDSLYRIKFIGKYLIEACSDVEVGTINHGTARKFFNRLDSLNLKFTSKQTYASVAIAAFNWAIKQGFVKTNYFAGKIALASKDEVVLAKEPFSVEEMKLVLGPKLLGWSFMEHNTVKGRFGNRRKPTPDYYWVTNIVAYTGARLGEVAQLTTNDIELRDNIWCFSFNNQNGKKIKT